MWRILVVVLAFAVSLAPGLTVADAQEVPTYRTLSCEANCPVFKPAVLKNMVKPVYPSKFTGGDGSTYVESLVDVHFTVGVDGAVKDAAVERLVGPEEFQTSVLNALKSWTFEPATENGVAVTQNLRREFFFRSVGEGDGARPKVAHDYSHAMELLDGKQTADAIAVFQAILTTPDLNFYERSMVSFALANIYLNQNNMLNALQMIRDATIDDGRTLDKRSQEAALRLRVHLEAANGNIADAFAWYDILKKYASISDDDADAKFVAGLHATITASKPLEFAAVTSSTSPATEGEWRHTLLKRSFGFADIQGHLNGFDLQCQTHAIHSPVSDAASWTVPKKWADCVIYVAGPVGTKFNFLEADAQPPTH